MAFFRKANNNFGHYCENFRRLVVASFAVISYLTRLHITPFIQMNAYEPRRSGEFRLEIGIISPKNVFHAKSSKKCYPDIGSIDRERSIFYIPMQCSKDPL
jgi:hypothetical protein